MYMYVERETKWISMIYNNTIYKLMPHTEMYFILCTISYFILVLWKGLKPIVQKKEVMQKLHFRAFYESLFCAWGLWKTRG